MQSRTAGELASVGHAVVAPPNPLRSLAFDASALSRAVKAIEGPVVLVATHTAAR